MNTAALPLRSAKPPRTGALVLLGVWLFGLMLHGWLATPAGHGGWVNCALRNAAEHGFWLCGGQPMINPGGAGLPAAPEIYRGYRGVSLLPLHGLHLVTGRLRASYWIWAALLSALVLASVWWWLGRGRLATITAAAVGLSPGFVRACAEWDPIPTTLLLGLPVIIALVGLATAEGARWRWGMLAVVVAVYALWEWAVTLALFIGWVALVVVWGRRQPSRLVQVTALLVVAVVLGVGALVWDRTGPREAGGVLRFALGYGFGSGYEGATMTWPLAIQRLGVASVVALLPLGVVWLVAVVRAARMWGGKIGVTLWPVWAAGIGVLGLRNAMAHHQWIAASTIMLGLVIALQLLRWRVRSTGGELWLPSRPLAVGLLLFVAAYAVVVVAALRENIRRPQRLIAFVQQHTPRAAVIVLGPGCQAGFRSPNVVSFMLDRHCVEWAEAVRNGVRAEPAYLLDVVPTAGAALPIAVLPPVERSWRGAGLDWYRQWIVQRRPGTYLTAEATFALSQWPVEAAP